MKKIIALLPATLLVANPVLAGPYVNVEANSGFVGSEYGGTVIDNHIGYEGENWYLQGGPAAVVPDGGDADTVPSGKAGLGLALTDALGAYGEVSFVGSGDEDIDRGYGTKIGLKYNF